MSKIDRTTHTVRWIAVENISVVWVEAQRGRNDKEIARIAREMDPDVFGVITVTRPDDAGMHHCIDGQTRINAVRLLWGDEERVPCQVLDVTDPVRAADIFVKMNTGRGSGSV